MQSDIQICNLALSRVGHSQPIVSFTERSKAAEQCAVFFAPIREQVLQDFPWPFAESTVALADLGNPMPGWGYRYRYPADCLKLRGILRPGHHRLLMADLAVPYKIGFDAGGRVVHTDAAEAVASFTYDVTDSTFFDPLFVNALAWRLGAELAIPLSAKVEYRQSCEQQYELAITKAQGAAFQESQDDPEPESEFISVRS